MCIEVSDFKRLESLVMELIESVKGPCFKQEWFSVQEAAVELGLNVQTVRRKCREKQLLRCRKRDGVTRFGREEWEIHHSAIEHYRNHKWSGGGT